MHRSSPQPNATPSLVALILFLSHGSHAPKSIEAYVQESGRAGRDGNPAQCVLYYAMPDFEPFSDVPAEKYAAGVFLIAGREQGEKSKS